MLAATADGHAVTTVEGLTEPDGTLGPVQQAFMECHGLQCGFCTPGFLTTATALLTANPDPSESETSKGSPATSPVHRIPEHQAAVRRAADLMAGAAPRAEQARAPIFDDPSGRPAGLGNGAL
jgi:carbon-monoxide dehydrogenase small subunit